MLLRDSEQDFGGFALRALLVGYEEDDMGKLFKEGSDSQGPSGVQTCGSRLAIKERIERPTGSLLNRCV